MTIVLIGTGSVGAALGSAFAGLGHRIVFGSRHPEREDVRSLASETEAAVLPPEDAVRGADLIVLAVPGEVAAETAASLGDLGGAVLLDTTNAADWNRLLPPEAELSLGEQVQAAAPAARVVKGFHTLAAQRMGSGRFDSGRASLFLSGDDADAKALVADLAEALGFEAVDTGGIDRARLTEPMALLWISLAGPQGWGRGFSFAVVRDAPGR
jgi:predicted dinucleotide-binding enzyme